MKIKKRFLFLGVALAATSSQSFATGDAAIMIPYMQQTLPFTLEKTLGSYLVNGVVGGFSDYMEAQNASADWGSMPYGITSFMYDPKNAIKEFANDKLVNYTDISDSLTSDYNSLKNFKDSESFYRDTTYRTLKFLNSSPKDSITNGISVFAPESAANIPDDVKVANFKTLVNYNPLPPIASTPDAEMQLVNNNDDVAKYMGLRNSYIAGNNVVADASSTVTSVNQQLNPKNKDGIISQLNQISKNNTAKGVKDPAVMRSIDQKLTLIATVLTNQLEVQKSNNQLLQVIASRLNQNQSVEAQKILKERDVNKGLIK